MQEIKKIFSVVPEKNASQMDKYRIYIKIQKLLSEIKIAAFVHSGGSATKQLR